MNLESLRKTVIILIIAIIPFNVFAKENDRVTLSTNWLAQAEHGGFYQALAKGIYNKYNLDLKFENLQQQTRMQTEMEI